MAISSPVLHTLVIFLQMRDRGAAFSNTRLEWSEQYHICSLQESSLTSESGCLGKAIFTLNWDHGPSYAGV